MLHPFQLAYLQGTFSTFHQSSVELLSSSDANNLDVIMEILDPFIHTQSLDGEIVFRPNFLDYLKQELKKFSFSNLTTDQKRYFLRGAFEFSFDTEKGHSPYYVSLTFQHSSIAQEISGFESFFHCKASGPLLELTYPSNIDFLTFIYHNSVNPIQSEAYDFYMKLTGHLNNRPLARTYPLPMVSVKQLTHQAQIPTKAHGSDVGYDVHLVGIEKRIKPNIYRMHTGLAIAPSYGYYVQIHPRSSLAKTGWMLANSTGIIDPAYRGELLVTLVKVSGETNEMDLDLSKPWVQLTVVPWVHAIFQPTQSLEHTRRGTGGFGSTNT